MRPFEEVRVDVERGYVSPEGAWKDYGVRIGPGNSVDEGGRAARLTRMFHRFSPNPAVTP